MFDFIGDALSDWILGFIKGIVSSWVGFICDICNEALGVIDKLDIFTLPLNTGAFAPVWAGTEAVATNVSMVLAYALLGFFVALEFYEATKQVSQTRFGGIEAIARCLIKIMLVKLFIDNAPALGKVIYDIGNSIALGVTKYLDAANIATGALYMPKDSLLSLINGATAADYGLLFMVSLMMLVSLFIVFGTVVIAIVVAVTRYVEIFVCIAFLAIPLVMCLGEQTKQKGIAFFTSFGAVCLQGAVILFLLKIMSPLFSAITNILAGVLGDGSLTGIQAIMACVAPLALCIAMFTVIQKTRDISNRIVNGG